MFEFDRRAVRRFTAGDVVAILAFVTVGEYQHSPFLFRPSQAADLAVQLAGAAVPFLVGWLVGAWAFGAYADGVSDSWLRLGGATVGGWLVADVLGQLLRRTAFFPGDASPVFFAVAAVFGAIFLLAWRTVATTTSLHKL
ncbi:DUF3054 domain-containing protein [Salarchaeum sp. JOR-1]|uniref:DUF3054 domain-containing protein n=1 Tax=Salarchaeum sp. JOR-1 TaxID=2599399 RepID=UPI0011987E11|nr:DUF3054 domain-containing protein [Salarchaeum sp. JOR-1]QDX41092.1 DUF3054 domain-containing protein [Salarchaeum sp. JOR-1]